MVRRFLVLWARHLAESFRTHAEELCELFIFNSGPLRGESQFFDSTFAKVRDTAKRDMAKGLLRALFLVDVVRLVFETLKDIKEEYKEPNQAFQQKQAINKAKKDMSFILSVTYELYVGIAHGQPMEFIAQINHGKAQKAFIQWKSQQMMKNPGSGEYQIRTLKSWGKAVHIEGQCDPIPYCLEEGARDVAEGVMTFESALHQGH